MKGSMHPLISAFVNRIALCALFCVAGAGCQSGLELMSTPNLYADSKSDPFANVPPDLRSNKVDVLYLTDRKPDNNSPDDPHYGYGRSRSVAFGVSTVEIGHN